MANSFFPKSITIVGEDPEDIFSVPLPHVYNVRQCPGCGAVLFGMPGGRDAHCAGCGFKDPCCSD